MANITSEYLSTFHKDALKQHNVLRKLHKVQKLQISQELNIAAQKWAEHMLKTGNFGHSQSGQGRGKNTGENLHYSYNSTNARPTGKDPVNSWYDEIKDYSWQANETDNWNKNTGHFTQVVWKATTHVGFGVAGNDQGKTFVVAQYSPAGNLWTTFAENVPSLNGERPKSIEKPAVPKTAPK